MDNDQDLQSSATKITLNTKTESQDSVNRRIFIVCYPARLF